nr:RecName: Full=Endo-1,4-beta-xylanase B; Short=Xylanase B; AltName: Full=1,4-beta-D-xylan xylanohydrolase B [Dictyoglomus sp. B4A]
AKKTILDLKD